MTATDTPGNPCLCLATALPDSMTLDEARALTHGYFQEAFYRHAARESLPADVDPLLHFLTVGWRLGLDPGPAFDVAFYLEANPDVASAGLNPLLHFVRFGYWEQRAPTRTPAEPPLAPNAGQVQFARLLCSAYFDEAYYRAQDPDLTPTDGNAFRHFLIRGWREGFDPGPKFDVHAYLTAYGDVAASNQNPLLHFVRYGEQEGRVARPPTDLWSRELDRAWAERAPATRSPQPFAPETLDPATLAELIRQSGAGQGDLVLAFSHDDYAESTGGVQNVVGDEQRAAAASGRPYLHISPMPDVLRLAENVDPSRAIVQLRLDGTKRGTLAVAGLATALRLVRAADRHVQPIVHHLAGFAPEHVSDLIAAAASRPPIVWVHDFFTLCESHALMRNNVAYCGGPPVDAMGCAICAYGPARAGHVERLRSFFERCNPDVLAPSASALDTWRGMGYAHRSGGVVPLARLQFDAERAGRASHPLRVAHLGGRSLMKGWAVFDRLMERHADDPRYEFYQLGWRDGPRAAAGLRAVDVDTRAHGRSAMIHAVRDHAIDVVVCWSACAETFCFTAHEALAGGAFVIARRDAGNVWPAVRDNAPEQGLVLETDAELFALFEGDALPELIARPRRFGELVPGCGSIDWLDAHG